MSRNRSRKQLVGFLALSAAIIVVSWKDCVEAGANDETPELHVIGLFTAGSPLFRLERLPSIYPQEFASWQRFWDKVRAEASRAEPSPGKRIWSLLPDKAKKFIEEGSFLKELDKARSTSPFLTLYRDTQVTEETLKADLAAGQRIEVIQALNQILKNRDFYDREAFQRVALPPLAVEMRGRLESLSYLETQCFNRLVLDAAYPNDVTPMYGLALPAGQAEVQVYRTDKPIVLVLVGNASIRWHLRLGEGVRLQKVILAGYQHQEVGGVVVPVENHVYFQEDQAPRPEMEYLQPLLDGHPSDKDRRRAEEERIERLARLRITTIQGRTSYDDTPFVVGIPPNQSGHLKYEMLVAALGSAGVPSVERDFPFADFAGFMWSLRAQWTRKEPSFGRRLCQYFDDDGRRLLEDERYFASIRRTEEEVKTAGRPNLYFGIPQTPRWLPRLQHALNQRDLYREDDFRGIGLSQQVLELLEKRNTLSMVDVRRLNWHLLEAAFPGTLKPLPATPLPPGHALVRVAARKKPIVLVLVGTEPVFWHVEAELGAKIEAVILNGFDEQVVEGVTCPVYFRKLPKDGRLVSFRPGYLDSEMDRPAWLNQVASVFNAELAQVRHSNSREFQGVISLRSE